jgi:hypothetical protein
MSNVPYIITQEEAVKKICPMSVGAGMNNRVLIYDGLEMGRACIGPHCMAWRWDFNWDEENNKSVYSDTLGYCGMVCG